MPSKILMKKLKLRKRKLSESTGNSLMLFIKPNETIRVRPLPVGEDNEPGEEIVHMYLGSELKGHISPKSLGEPCALYEKYEELKEAGDADDKGLMDKLKPKTKYVIPVIRKKSPTNKEVDQKVGVRLLLVSKGVYQQLIDLFMDPEQGDFTDPRKGYDIKITRTGAGITDTEYSVIPCRPSKILQKEYRKIVSIEDMLRKIVPSYDETKTMLSQLLPSSKRRKKLKSKKIRS